MIGSDACAGRLTFTGTRSDSLVVNDAGAFSGSSYAALNHAAFGSGNPFTVTLSRPLAVGDTAFIEENGLLGGGTVGIDQERDIKVGVCPAGPPPPPPPPPVPPTDAQVKAALKTQLAAAAKALKKHKLRALAKQEHLTLAFAFPDAGTIKLTLTAKTGKRTITIGGGRKTASAASAGKVTVKFTSQGRKLLRHARKLTVTLRGSFSRTRAGTKTQSATATAALKR